GLGICTAGVMLCAGGTLQCAGGQGPQGEICNGLDDDCNGRVDDLPSLGKGCTPPRGCAGVLAGDGAKMQVVCSTLGMAADGTCRAQPLPQPPICVDKCEGVQCPKGYACVGGACRDVTCVGKPALCRACDGQSGERCDVTARACVPDRCCGKACGAGFCEPS